MTKPSINYPERDAQVLAQGQTGTNSKRASQYPRGCPTHFSKLEGCNLYDEKGKKYIDFVSGLGVNILGYNHPKVIESAQIQLGRGVSGSLPSIMEGEVAEIIREMVPTAEKIRFLKTGNEATLAAVRIARAYSKEALVINEGYHGHGDLWTSLSPPALGVVDTFHITDDVGPTGIVILEPIMTDASETRKESVKAAHARCDVTIFDEIVTGFRVPKYTVSQWWGIEPDIICLGKALANGFPLAVVGGTKEVMDCGEYFISSTFSGEAVSLAACKATLEVLRTKNMDDLYFYANRFQDRLNAIIKPLGCKFEGYGTRAMFGPWDEKSACFVQQCAKAGVLFGKAFFYNFAHLESNIEELVLNIASDAVSATEAGRVNLEGPVPTQTFKR